MPAPSVLMTILKAFSIATFRVRALGMHDNAQLHVADPEPVFTLQAKAQMPQMIDGLAFGPFQPSTLPRRPVRHSSGPCSLLNR
jgi:hypothetical protein